MSQSLVYILLLFALALPVLGALVLRVLGSRLTPAQLYGAAAAILGVALVSIFLLVRSDVPSLQVGGLSILLPVAAPEDSGLVVAEPELVPTQPTSGPADTTSAPVATPTAAVPAAPIATSIASTAAPTQAPTAPPAPTVPPQPPAPRKYTVQPGDTLKSIAEQFNVSVTALVETNKLTPEQADSLRVGQELTIP